MTDRKHTPAPWVVEMDERWPFDIIIAPDVACMARYAYGTKDKSISDVRSANSFDYDERDHIASMVAQQEANARLIAAAPDMLEALEELADLLDAIISGEYQPDSFTTQYARRVIAKAKGEE